MIKKSHMSYNEILEMGYSEFLGLRKEFILQDLNSTEEGRKLLEDSKKYEQKDADVSFISKLKNEHEKSKQSTL